MTRYVGCPWCGKTITAEQTPCPHCGQATTERPVAPPRDDDDVDEIALMAAMTDEQRRLFERRMAAVRKNPTTGVLLAVFLGGIGVHHFWIGNVLAGVVYLLFSWTLIPAGLALIEAFFMPGRVRLFNSGRARKLARQITRLPAAATV